MTTSEAKKDCAARLAKAGIQYAKLTAKTIDFSDLARCSPVFVAIHEAQVIVGKGIKAIFVDVPKPSEGGYVVELNNPTWKEG